MTLPAIPPLFHPWRWRARLLRLKGWRASLVLLLAGAVSALAMAPLHVWPAMMIGLVALLWSVDGVRGREKPLRTAFWRGFVFGFGYFAAGTFWLANAFISRGPEFKFMIPFALPAFFAMLAVFWGVAMLLYVAVAQKSVWRILVFAAAIASTEWLRGHVFSGLPWNLPAYAWSAGATMSQAASWMGVYGLSFLTIFMLASPGVLIARGEEFKRWLPSLGAIIIALVLFASGAYRLASFTVHYHPDVRLRIVHMAITQEEKWADGGAPRALQRYLNWSGQPGMDDVSHVLWPEGALPLFYDEMGRASLFQENGDALLQTSEVFAGGPQLVLGTSRREAGLDGDVRFYNSLWSVSFPDGWPDSTGFYDKTLLVPFSEILPLSGLISMLGFEEFARLQFTPGPGPAVLDIPGAPPMMPLICYEAIFPGFVRRAPDGAEWIYNLSNDAWFGTTSGPEQHVNQARYRSIETGLPMVRATSRGVSGVIDPLGRMPVRIEPEAEGAYDVELPRAVAAPLYQYLGDWPFLLGIFSIFGAIVLQRWRRRR